MKLNILTTLIGGIDIPPWFIETLTGLGGACAYVFARFSKTDVSESKLNGVLATVTTMGASVTKMGEASAARQEQIQNLQNTDGQLRQEMQALRSELSELRNQVSYLRGQLNK
jgi:hypothetical protein